MLNTVFTESHIQKVALLLILSLGAFFRLYGLETQSFWNDELSSWDRSNFDNLSEVIDKGVRPDVHPPGYQMLLYYIERYIGESEAVLRFPSVIAGIFSILVIFLIGRRIYSYREGLIAASLMAVLWTPIFYSQETRAYSMLMLFTLLAVYFWIDILLNLNKEIKPPFYVTLAYLTTAIIASYLHYYGLFFIMLQGLGLILFIPRTGRAFLFVFTLYALILLAYLPWIPTMISQFYDEGEGNISPPESDAFLAYLEFLFNESRMLLFIVLALYGFLLLHSFYNLFKTRTDQVSPLRVSPGLLLALWLIVPFVIIYLISITARPVLTNRNLIISLPAAYLLLARAITQLPISRIGQTIVVFSIIGLFLYHLLFDKDYYSEPHKEQFREAVGFAADRAHLYEDSLVIGYVWDPDYLNYYFEKKSSKLRVDRVAGQEEDIPGLIKYVKTENPNYLWYISAHRIPSPEFIDSLSQNFTLIDHESFIKANVWLFKTS